jgi:TPR repeat protein
MMTGTNHAVSNQARSWGHNAIRLAILAAARRIVACEGPDAVTLSRAADEAGFARATVYGHFRNKEELLVSVIADDMATLGRMMREAGWDSHSETSLVDPEPIAVSPANDAPDVEDGASQEEFVPEEHTTLEEVLPAAIAVPPEAKPSADFRAVLTRQSGPIALAPHPSIRRADIRAVLAAQEPAPAEHESAVDNEEPASRGDSGLKIELPRVDAWLERRLRVFERALADIETRLEKAERGSERAQGLVAEGMRDLQFQVDAADRRQRESIENIARRTETSDQRLRGSIAELRAMLNESFGLPPDAPMQSPENSLRYEVAEHHLEMPQPPVTITDEEPSATDISRQPSESFLAAARRAANAAAQLAEAEHAANGPLMGGMRWAEDDGARRKLYTRYLMGGAAFLVLILLGAGMVLRHDATNTKPVRAVAALPAPVKRPMQASAPLDRLSVLANAGNANAELVVGLKYLQSTPANDSEAAFWLHRAADAHQAVAQYFLGTLYEHGKGVGADAAKAVQWYEAAAAQGNRKAMHRLGVAYAEGTGVTKDLTQSAGWFAKAANAGLVDAQFNLAVLYERGQGVPQSLLDAYKWYAIAAAQGDVESRSRVEALATQLSPDDVAAAERTVQGFVPTAVDPRANIAPEPAEILGAR